MAGKRKMSAENSKMIRALIDNGRTVGPQILADDYLSIAVGMIGFACTESMITLDEHAAYWAEINEIKEDRAEARKSLESSNAQKESSRTLHYAARSPAYPSSARVGRAHDR